VRRWLGLVAGLAVAAALVFTLVDRLLRRLTLPLFETWGILTLHSLLVDRVQRVRRRGEVVEREATLCDALHFVHRGRMRGRVADERGVDAVRHRITECERVGRDEQRAHDDRDGGDGHRFRQGGPAVPGCFGSAHRPASGEGSTCTGWASTEWWR
jgi:hypothetical protein